MSWISRIFLGLFGLGLLLGLLLALGVYTVWATLRWLLTGRKPQVVLVWQQFSALRRGLGAQRDGTGMRSPFDARQAELGDVVDVPSREVHESTPRG